VYVTGPDTPAADDEQASARRLVAPAWLPHPFKSGGAELTTPIHARRKPVVDRDSGLPLVVQGASDLAATRSAGPVQERQSQHALPLVVHLESVVVDH
jgi:hypothetical protein